MACQFTHIDAIDIVLLPWEKMKHNGLEIQAIPADTPAISLKDLHYNIILLNYQSLGIIKKMIVEEFVYDRIKRITAKKIIDLISEGVKSGKVNKDRLNPDVKKKITADISK